jgi:hypothetical protein
MQVKLTELVLEYAAIVEPVKNKKWTAFDSVDVDNQQTGHIALVKSWHGIGRKDLAPTLSSSLVRTGYAFNAGCRVLDEMSLL